MTALPQSARSRISFDDEKAALLLLGRIQATDRIAATLSAEVVRALIVVQETKAYKQLGYQQFVDYLSDANVSPMTKHEFYARKDRLEAEGDPLYDLLSGMGIPLNKRKQLGSGQVEFDGKNVTFKTEEGDVVIDRGETSRLIELVSALADANTEKTMKIEKGEKDIDRWKQRYFDLEESGNGNGTMDRTALDKSHTAAIGGLSELAAELEKALEADLLHYADGQLTLLATQFNRINVLLSGKIGVDSITQLETAGGDDDGDRLATLLDED